MRIIDDALPSEQFKELQTVILDKNFPWFYARTTYENETITNPYLYGWAHYVFTEEGWRSHISELINDSLRIAFGQIGEPVNAFLRIRIIANTTAPEPFLNGPHVDIPNPHKTALFYINETDGDTVLYNEIWESHYDEKMPELTVMQTIQPKPNRLLMFNGLHFHTGTLPVKSNRRILMNVNYV